MLDRFKERIEGQCALKYIVFYIPTSEHMLYLQPRMTIPSSLLSRKLLPTLQDIAQILPPLWCLPLSPTVEVEHFLLCIPTIDLNPYHPALGLTYLHFCLPLWTWSRLTARAMSFIYAYLCSLLLSALGMTNTRCTASTYWTETLNIYYCWHSHRFWAYKRICLHWSSQECRLWCQKLDSNPIPTTY